MTLQQELELLAEWLGIKRDINWLGHREYNPEWNPLTNDTDFINMVAGRVDFEWHDVFVAAMTVDDDPYWCQSEFYADHNNDKLAAMKHAAYQVCLMAAREWKGEQ